jgi:hypothetical protein
MCKWDGDTQGPEQPGVYEVLTEAGDRLRLRWIKIDKPDAGFISPPDQAGGWRWVSEKNEPWKVYRVAKWRKIQGS